ncbi:hypothetical protein [Spiroplasma endosymbiont of Nebria brevicollis]|uniref:hypothetical protein n=1 Tax=Spiroplasma endosymbiont of Nebria brevicollis TaxID=3066284 RepID=UPI00313BA19A
MQAIENTTCLTTPSVYVIWSGKSKEAVTSQLQSVISNTSFSSLNVQSLSQANLLNLWKQFTFKQETVETYSTEFIAENINGFIWTINDLPKQINYFWLNKLFSLGNVNVCVNLNPINKLQAKKTIG